jgi:hypothetical protein
MLVYVVDWLRYVFLLYAPLSAATGTHFNHRPRRRKHYESLVFVCSKIVFIISLPSFVASGNLGSKYFWMASNFSLYPSKLPSVTLLLQSREGVVVDGRFDGFFEELVVAEEVLCDA